MTTAKLYIWLYLAAAGICIPISALGLIPSDNIFYCLIISTIWQAAKYIKDD